MAGNKTLNARLSLKYDTYDNWTKNNPILLTGEAAVTVVPGDTGAVQREPAVLIKFGDGSSHYNDLQFMSAKSADVYDWAMQAQKPTYQASEIQGLDDYISGQIKDTDTQYQLVRVDDKSFKLQSKEKNGDVWSDVSTIEITYTLVEGDTNGTVKFNGTDVTVHGLKSAAYQDTTAFDAAGAADAVQAAVIGSDGDQSTANSIYGAKKYAEEKATAAQTAAVENANGYTDGKITELNIDQYAKTVDVDSKVAATKTELIGTDDDTGTNDTIKGAKKYADAQIAAQVASAYKAAGSVGFSSLPALSATEEGRVYNVTDAFTTTDDFIEGAGNSYPAGTNVVCIDTGDETFKWDVLAGIVDLSTYDTAEVAAGKVAAAKQEAIEAAASDATSKANAALEDAKEYADGLNTAMDGRVSAVEADKHTHANKALLDTYTQTEENLADAVAKKHEHTNKTVLDTITQEKITSWDGKADDSALATVAKSGKIQDLIQDEGTYIVIDCGSATINI